MRIIFMGSGAFALPTLRWLSESAHQIAAVVTQPARASGRGRRTARTPVRAAADELGLRSLEPADVNDADVVAALGALGADLGVVIAFGQKINRPLRDAMRGGCINLHASLLPRYRGAAPIHWAIARGETKTGCTVFRLVDRMDAGPILSRSETGIEPMDTAGDLHDRLAALGVETVRSALAQFADGKVPAGRPQNDEEATAAPRLVKEDGVIDFDQPARQVVSHIHGMTPWPGARARFEGDDDRWENVSIVRALAVERTGEKARAPGEVTCDGTIATRDAAVAVLEIKPSSGRVMGWRDYVNGRHVRPGDRFVSPRP